MSIATLGAPVAAVADVPVFAVRMRTVAPVLRRSTVDVPNSDVPSFDGAVWQNAAAVQVDVTPLQGMRPTVADERRYAASGTPKHALRTYAPSGNPLCIWDCNWSPPV